MINDTIQSDQQNVTWGSAITNTNRNQLPSTSNKSEQENRFQTRYTQQTLSKACDVSEAMYDKGCISSSITNNNS